MPGRLQVVWALSLVWVLAGPVAAQSPTRWNVLLIVADDLNTALGCYGHPVADSPNIDRRRPDARLAGILPEGREIAPSPTRFRTLVPRVVSGPKEESLRTPQGVRHEPAA